MAKKKAEKTPTTHEPANAVPGESNIETMSGPPGMAYCPIDDSGRTSGTEPATNRSSFRRIDSAKPIEKQGFIALCQEF